MKRLIWLIVLLLAACSSPKIEQDQQNRDVVQEIEQWLEAETDQNVAVVVHVENEPNRIEDDTIVLANDNRREERLPDEIRGIAFLGEELFVVYAFPDENAEGGWINYIRSETNCVFYSEEGHWLITNLYNSPTIMSYSLANMETLWNELRIPLMEEKVTAVHYRDDPDWGTPKVLESDLGIGGLTVAYPVYYPNEQKIDIEIYDLTDDWQGRMLGGVPGDPTSNVAVSPSGQLVAFVSQVSFLDIWQVDLEGTLPHVHCVYHEEYKEGTPRIWLPNESQVVSLVGGENQRLIITNFEENTSVQFEIPEGFFLSYLAFGKSL